MESVGQTYNPILYLVILWLTLSTGWTYRGNLEHVAASEIGELNECQQWGHGYDLLTGTLETTNVVVMKY